MDDRELLREYVTRQSEAAFAELVARHLPGVLATAQRLMREPQAAADVAQTVFIQLARKAWTIREGQVLTGWLYRATRNAAFNALRDEQRRQQRETHAMQDAEIQSSSEPRWADFAPLVDDAMRQLKRPEQDVVLLRFFEGKSYGEIGRLLNLDEKTAGQRAHRALEKMRLHFSSRGVTTTAVLLGSVLGAHGATALPAEMTARVAGTSLASAGGSTSYALLLKALYMTATTKLVLTAAILAVAFTSGWFSAEPAAAHAAPPAKSAVAKTPTPISAADLLAKARAELIKALHIPSRNNRERTLLDIVEELDAVTAKALLAEFATQPLTGSNQLLVGDLAYRWAELDYDAALAWLQTVPSREVQLLCAGKIFDAFSAKDAPAAFAALTELPANYDFSQLSVIVLMNYAEQDPRAALAALQSVADNSKFSYLTVVVFGQWTQQDPTAAAAAVIDLSAGPQQQLSVRSVAENWATQDPAAALKWADTLPQGQMQNEAKNVALSTFSKVDPLGAASYFLANYPARQGPVILNIARDWAGIDPSALLTWADQNLTGQAYNRAANLALQQLANTDPKAAATYLAQNPDPNVLAQVVPALAITWGQEDPQAALDWAQSLPPDNVSLRNSAISQALSGWVATNPTAATTYLQQNFANSPEFGNMTSQLATAWGATDPQAALQWAKSLPPEEQGRVSIAAMTQLAKFDPQAGSKAAQAALGSLPNLTESQQTALRKIIDAAASH